MNIVLLKVHPHLSGPIKAKSIKAKAKSFYFLFLNAVLLHILGPWRAETVHSRSERGFMFTDTRDVTGNRTVIILILYQKVLYQLSFWFRFGVLWGNHLWNVAWIWLDELQTRHNLQELVPTIFYKTSFLVLFINLWEHRS